MDTHKHRLVFEWIVVEFQQRDVENRRGEVSWRVCDVQEGPTRMNLLLWSTAAV